MNPTYTRLLPALLVCIAAVPAQEPTLPADWPDALEWRAIGPANMGGRIIDLEVVADDPSTWWVATASGGLLKTTNNGITFEHQFDHEATVSIGAMAIAPSDPDIVWVGTGENNPRNSVSYGNGVYKSTDGGETWKHMGLEESFQTGDVIVHPEDPDIVYVGALGRLYGPNEQRGLYRTTDGGETWERILHVDDKTGVIDIALHPENPDVFLVATYERQRDGYDTNDPAVKIAPGSGLYRTTDGGKSFQEVTEGLPTVDLGRIGLEWNYLDDPDVVFAIVESELIGEPGENVGWPGFDADSIEAGAKVTGVVEDGPAAQAGLKEDDIVLSVDGETVLNERQMLEGIMQHEVGDEVELLIARGEDTETLTLELAARPEPEEGERRRRRRGVRFGSRLGGQQANLQRLQGSNGWQHGGLYRSDDGGVSWRRINSINPRPMYFSQVRVDPHDDQRLYVLGIRAARSEDGGETFTSDASRGVHSDQHAMWIDPDDGRHMILGTDGGLYVSYDRCENWDHLNHTAIGQFYHVTTGPRRDYMVYGGLQDNGSWGGPHRNPRGRGPVNEDWLRVGGGDGFVCRVDPEDPDQIYLESQNGGTRRTHLATLEGERIRPPREHEGERVRYRFNWRTPFILSHHNSRIYYCAGNHVFRSLDRGDRLQRISPDITRGDRGSATALAESPRDENVLYVGTDDGALWGTRDGGVSWTDLWQTAEPEAEDITTTASTRGGPRAPEPAAAPAAGEDGAAPLAELVPGPRWVASIEASRHADGRVYLSLDGHRSDDDAPYLLISEDHGGTWRSLADDLPRGSIRTLREDRVNPDVLYCGTEFAAWVSIDRGETWTKLNGGQLPTVAIHELAQHPSCGEVVAATHGRSLWIVDVTPLRHMSAETVAAPVHLYPPAPAIQWQTLHRHGSTGGARQFTGENPPDTASIFYSLAEDTGDVSLEIRRPNGELVRTLEAPGDAGLNRVTWDLRAEPDEDSRSRRRRRRGRTVDEGRYVVVLAVGDQEHRQPLDVRPDPSRQ